MLDYNINIIIILKRHVSPSAMQALSHQKATRCNFKRTSIIHMLVWNSNIFMRAISYVILPMKGITCPCSYK
jgi:hypothetical protein